MRKIKSSISKWLIEIENERDEKMSMYTTTYITLVWGVRLSPFKVLRKICRI